MVDSIHRVARPQGSWHIMRCDLLSTPVRAGFNWQALWQGLQQSFRLMVGVQDYPKYLQHMRQHHPDTPPMSERDFHRYCLDARFPSQAGKLGKCPC